MIDCPHPYYIASVIHPRPDIGVIQLSPDGPALRWQPGQYVFMSVPPHVPRPISIACAPNPAGVIEIHVRHSGRGGLSAWLCDQAIAGDLVHFSDPAGRSILDHSEAEPILFIAGGLGIAPVKAMIDHAITSGATAPMALVWGTAKPEDIYLNDYFAGLAEVAPFTVTTTHARSAVAETVAHYPDLAHFRIYIAGPDAMVIDALPILLAHGAKPDRIHFDSAEPIDITRSRS